LKKDGPLRFAGSSEGNTPIWPRESISSLPKRIAKDILSKEKTKSNKHLVKEDTLTKCRGKNLGGGGLKRSYLVEGGTPHLFRKTLEGNWGGKRGAKGAKGPMKKLKSQSRRDKRFSRQLF